MVLVKKRRNYNHVAGSLHPLREFFALIRIYCKKKRLMEENEYLKNYLQNTKTCQKTMTKSRGKL